MPAVAAASPQSVTVPLVFVEPRGLLPASAGEVLGDRYVVENELGEGGGGVVFRAWDRRAGAAVAVKILHTALAARPVWVRRLEREMALARRIRHPNVCSIFDFQHWGGRAFIVMELAVGSLFDEQARSRAADAGGPADWERRARDARDACLGLAAIHEAGIVHRDIKPGNILRMSDGRLVVADFGMAVAAGDTITFGGGTPSYLPPEVNLGGTHELRSDVWQLGVVLHEILLGRRPAWRPDGDRPWRPEVPTGLPREVGRAIRVALRCLRWDPAARPGSATAVAHLLTRCWK
jgi:serine/threonine-protein kinase